MTNSHAHTQLLQDRFGRRIAVRLNAGTSELPHSVTERLRASRMQALAQRKQAVANPVRSWAWLGAKAFGGSGGERGMGLWGRVASALPVIALAAGLIAINVIQNERRASELAEVDAAILTDDLPPSAYADPAFVQFLKTDQ